MKRKCNVVLEEDEERAEKRPTIRSPSYRGFMDRSLNTNSSPMPCSDGSTSTHTHLAVVSDQIPSLILSPTPSSTDTVSPTTSSSSTPMSCDDFDDDLEIHTLADLLSTMCNLEEAAVIPVSTQAELISEAEELTDGGGVLRQATTPTSPPEESTSRLVTTPPEEGLPITASRRRRQMILRLHLVVDVEVESGPM